MVCERAKRDDKSACGDVCVSLSRSACGVVNAHGATHDITAVRLDGLIRRPTLSKLNKTTTLRTHTHTHIHTHTQREEMSAADPHTAMVAVSLCCSSLFPASAVC